jgi:hypothetical protein
MQSEVLEDLKNLDGNILEVKKKLVAKYGKACLEPAEEEQAKNNKEEFLEGYLKGAKPSEEFNDFFYNNDLQERIWNEIKAQSIEEYKKEAEAFERDFPALPSSSTPKSQINEAWKFTKSMNEKIETIKKHFPVLDKQTIEYVLFNFSYQMPAAMTYLRDKYPENYIEVNEAPHKVIDKSDFVLTKSKPKVYLLHNKSKDKEDRVKKILGQKVVGPESKYSVIRKDADTYLRLFHIYMRNKQHAHSAGQHSEANKFKRLAENYYALYIEANEQAVDETLNQRLFLYYL